MTREEAVQLLFQLTNSGILSEELEEQLGDLANRICQNHFEKCIGNDYCGDCPNRYSRQ